MCWRPLQRTDAAPINLKTGLNSMSWEHKPIYGTDLYIREPVSMASADTPLSGVGFGLFPPLYTGTYSQPPAPETLRPQIVSITPNSRSLNGGIKSSCLRNLDARYSSHRCHDVRSNEGQLAHFGKRRREMTFWRMTLPSGACQIQSSSSIRKSNGGSRISTCVVGNP